MGNTHNYVQEEQLQIIQDKLHAPELDIEPDKIKTEEVASLTALELRSRLLEARDIKLPEAFKIFHCKKRLENNEHRVLTDVLYDKPLKRAEELQQMIDEKRLEPKDVPLLGFILSIKDANKLKSTVSTNGFAINVGLVETEQPRSIKLLIEKGALITCKGNVPQALFSMECMNNVFGNAVNPYDEARTTGGSSGGDAALIALKCVNTALGSDVAGSLRIPALFCGIVGFKPTVNRISNDQLCTYFYKQPFAKSFASRINIIRPTIGPLANSVSDAEALMKVLIETQKYDRLVPPLPWRKVDKPKRVGLFTEFNQLEVAAAYKRALNIAAEALEKNGIEIVPLNFDDFFEDILITSATAFMKNDLLRTIIEGNAPIDEPLASNFKNFHKLLNSPNFLAKFLAKRDTTDRKILFLRAVVKHRSVNINAIEQENTLIYDKIKGRMDKNEIELLLAPGMVTPAVLHGSSNENSIQAIYTFMFNLLDFPVGAIPITRVASNEQLYETKYDDTIAKSLKENMKGSEGLPVGIQVAALPWMDEEVFEIMKLIENEVKNK